MVQLITFLFGVVYYAIVGAHQKIRVGLEISITLEDGQVCCNGSKIFYHCRWLMGYGSPILMQALQKELDLSGVACASPLVGLVTTHN